jgi:signal transduction histidine kinase
MSFLEYVKDKRNFLIFYAIIMSFVTVIMIVGFNEQETLNNVLYTNISCSLFASLYIIIGYYYRRKFYRELKEAIESGQEEIRAILPEAQNFEQKLFLKLLKKVHQDQNNQLEKLYDEKRDQQEFIMSWIHEVKLPIAASRLLLENSEDKTVDMLVDKFEDELDKIDDYVEQALYYSRIDSFSKDYFITEIKVNKIIKNSVKKYAKLFINKGIRFDMREEGQYVQSDSKWLGFVIDQIISNSLKYTNEGGEISIHFEEDTKEKRLLIQDNGIGIKPEDIHRVFEKGFTGSTGRSHAKSTGMGLYLVKQLANKLGHNITIESEEAKYTKAVIHFPKIRNYYHLS